MGLVRTTRGVSPEPVWPDDPAGGVDAAGEGDDGELLPAVEVEVDVGVGLEVEVEVDPDVVDPDVVGPDVVGLAGGAAVVGGGVVVVVVAWGDATSMVP
jgi:hypothetical protein